MGGSLGRLLLVEMLLRWNKCGCDAGCVAAYGTQASWAGACRGIHGSHCRVAARCKARHGVMMAWLAARGLWLQCHMVGFNPGSQGKAKGDSTTG
jgi:hypothetical protein